MLLKAEHRRLQEIEIKRLREVISSWIYITTSSFKKEQGMIKVVKIGSFLNHLTRKMQLDENYCRHMCIKIS
jgi:hypothetical protein